MSEDFRYTYSLKHGREMFVVRSNDFRELLESREEVIETLSLEEGFPGESPPEERAEAVANAPRTKRPYKHPGDACGNNCGGILQLKDSTNSQTKQPFQFLGCSNFPECEFTAYLSKFPKKAKA